MSVEPSLVLLNSQVLGKPESIETVLEAFVQARFDVYDFVVGGRQLAPTHGQGNYRLSDDGFRVAYEQSQVRFCVRRSSNIGDGMSFELIVHLGWGEKHFKKMGRTWTGASSWQSPLFRSWGDYDGKYYSKLFLETGSLLYSALLPEIGWLDYGDYGAFPSFQDVEGESVPNMYWANYFSPKWVARIGEDRLRLAPVGQIDTLVDNGLLYVLSPYLGEMENRDTIQQHFGES